MTQTKAPSAAHVATASAILENVRWAINESRTEFHHLGDLAAVMGLEGQEDRLRAVLLAKGYACPVIALEDAAAHEGYLFEIEGEGSTLVPEVVLVEQRAIREALGDSEDPATAWAAWRDQIAAEVAA